MTQIIVAVISFLMTHVSNLFSPYQDSLSELFSKITEVSSFIFDIFDMVNFIIPIDVIFFCVEYMVVFYLGGLTVWIGNWLICRLCDVIP